MGETIFITGATGFMGRSLINELIRRGHAVRGLTRSASRGRLPDGCQAVIGDAREPESYASAIAGCDTFVQLVGVAHPSPAKAASFETVDRAAGLGAVEAAANAGVRHFVYVSVAQPAPVMKAYVAARAAVEESIRRSGLRATVLRPWYVLGPGRRWPFLLLPFYWLLERIPATAESARRLGFVSIDQMTAALVNAVECPPTAGMRIWDVPAIRRGGNDE